MIVVMMWLSERLSAMASARDERGLVTAESLGVAAFGLVAMAAIFVLIKSFGADVFTWLRGQTGI